MPDDQMPATLPFPGADAVAKLPLARLLEFKKTVLAPTREQLWQERDELLDGIDEVLREFRYLYVQTRVLMANFAPLLDHQNFEAVDYEEVRATINRIGEKETVWLKGWLETNPTSTTTPTGKS
jgi:hypothetical protein